ncbi:DUF2283 domain-containing protein [Bradyrhizobium sp.]|jgi:uncharacterized protein YuzE|uniref:DUF2283 domain-containing protein n=1 Tax=Bradyrhizobium sp. TaxID=376 RepID=UPI002DFECA87|nr:DUF2283 domain-containing protein [Bradyrhizobium sp.]
MVETTYDPEVDAVYIALTRGKVERTKEAGPFVYDVDADGRVLGIEILSATRVLAPGDWKKIRRPKESARRRHKVAERHRGFIFVKRLSPPDVDSR